MKYFVFIILNGILVTQFCCAQKLDFFVEYKIARTNYFPNLKNTNVYQNNIKNYSLQQISIANPQFGLGINAKLRNNLGSTVNLDYSKDYCQLSLTNFYDNAQLYRLFSIQNIKLSACINLSKMILKNKFYFGIGVSNIIPILLSKSEINSKRTILPGDNLSTPDIVREDFKLQNKPKLLSSCFSQIRYDLLSEKLKGFFLFDFQYTFNSPTQVHWAWDGKEMVSIKPNSFGFSLGFGVYIK